MNNHKGVTSEVYDAIYMTDMCHEFKVLPRSGGFLEQDQLDIRKMHIITELRHEQIKKEKAKK